MWDQWGHYLSAGRRNWKGQILAGRPLLPPLTEGHASAMCPSTPSGSVLFRVLASCIWGTPLFDNCVTFSQRQVSRPVTSGRRLSVKMCSCLCLMTVLMVLPKEHSFGVRQRLMWGDRGDTDRVRLAVFDKVALARWELSYYDGTLHEAPLRRCLP